MNNTSTSTNKSHWEATLIYTTYVKVFLEYTSWVAKSLDCGTNLCGFKSQLHNLLSVTSGKFLYLFMPQLANIKWEWKQYLPQKVIFKKAI